jgi:tripartite-type tricarboxylate transporter receptor subunit TctC
MNGMRFGKGSGRFGTCLSLVALCLAASGASLAQGYPVKPIRMIVPFTPGGGSDTMGRAVAKHWGERFGQAVVVENRLGAAGSIGADFVAKAAPDGYTVLLGSTSELTQYPNVNPKVPYDPVRDFAPVSMVGHIPLVLVVHPSMPVKSVKDLIALAKARPAQMLFGSAGVGATTHLAVEHFILLTDVKLTHVPYKGSVQATADLVAGNIQMAIPTLPSALPFIQARRVKVLAVTTAKRVPVLADAPTMQEAGVKGYVNVLWTGVLAPAGAPPAVIKRLHEETLAALDSAEVKKVLAGVGAEPQGSTPEEFAAFIRSELAKWAKVVKAAGVRPD